MSNLFELAASYRALSERLNDPETELDEQTIADTLDGESGDLSEKVINTAKLLKNLEAEADAIRAAVDQMMGRAKAKDKRIESLKQYLLTNMELAGLPKVPSPWFVVSIRTNQPSVVIDDPAAIPKDYLREVPATTAPNKVLMKQAMNDGFDVPGAHLIRTKSVSIK